MSDRGSNPDRADIASPTSDRAAARRNNGFSYSTLAMWGLAAVVILACVIIGLQIFVAEKIPELNAARLEAAYELWQRDGPKNYEMDVEIRGAQPGAVHVEVRNGDVTAETRDGRTPPQWTWYAWSVPGLFETLKQELALAEDPEHEMDAPAGTRLQLRCEFDSKFGLPRRYHRFTTGGAPEVYWRVTEFTPK